MMNNITKIVIIGCTFLALLHAGGSSAAVAAQGRDSISEFSFRFRFQDTKHLYDYKGNAVQHDRLMEILSDSTTGKLAKLEISGYASPDGYDAGNEVLAKNRAISVRGFMYWKFPYLKEIPTVMNSEVVEWDVVINAIERDPAVPNKDQVLRILRSSLSSQDKTTQVRLLPGDTYRYLLQEIFSNHWEGVSCVLHYSNDDQASDVTLSTDTPTEEGTVTLPVEPTSSDMDTTDTSQAPSEILIPKPRTAKEKRYLRPMMAIKTDLVQWGGLTPSFDGLHTYTPNLALEVFFGGRWSAEIGGSYSNWETFKRDQGVWAVSQAYVEPRFWFRNDGLFRGFYAGLYGQYGQYDVQNLATGHTGNYYTGGVSVGFMQALSKHWYLELGVRGGYRSSESSLYDIEPDHYYFNSAVNKDTFVPQVRLNLNYRIGGKSKTK